MFAMFYVNQRTLTDGYLKYIWTYVNRLRAMHCKGCLKLCRPAYYSKTVFEF